ncbi:hypothetical protein COCC4DRAFT_56859 [Bipolaris maydis ATCC 48331]|uniref:Ankyrin repeat protein n=2 Tax=Cochliobolus heterostrophus TaxID=5016 RepID=M2URD9_COCH5|nr:uncharacterized protein COCC4DRAFT_56859 [Bipolaris maydis ATCC 48331]EMD90453.1 hypothetical protein COCHEDRAFT_1225927 [Bipolaris maydis C5]KAH7555413.1 hypothetical protein BM1_07036 [Bipolaris maydis]ENI09334.1 hypothetical protein COCC4DRAFT_56859 [Bipolaris maydis ATCC 48331]KAJ5023723.1 hypothetical protein J3E73DRAFT_384100 [Bipolaris maydis]KAJ6206361.1 hypothetical protein PSV09DRAFT_1225927 [Bipolaris maydis]
MPDNGFNQLRSLSPLVNAIKLGKLSIVKKLIEYLRYSPLTQAHGYALLKTPSTNFPIYKAIQMLITYNRDDILFRLAKLIRHKFGRIDLADFDVCVRLVARTSNIRVVRSLFGIPASPAWTLTPNTMCTICNSADYDLIYFAFHEADCANQCINSRGHPLHIAVRAVLEATRAVHDTEKYDINERVIYTFKSYWNEPVTALDIANFYENHAIIKWLLDYGANYPRRFPYSHISGRIYNCIRDRAIVDDPGMRDSPSYGQYQSMSVEARERFVFGLDQ